MPGLFEKLASGCIERIPLGRYPLFSMVHRTLASIALGQLDVVEIQRSLAKEEERDYNSDVFAAVRETAAAVILSRMATSSDQHWQERLSLYMGRLQSDASVPKEHKATASDLFLAAQLVKGEHESIRQARDIRWGCHPGPSENAFSALLLAETARVLEGLPHDVRDIGPFSVLALQGGDVPVLAVALCRASLAGPPGELFGSALALDQQLLNSKGSLRMKPLSTSTWDIAAMDDDESLDLVATVRGEGGVVEAAPWAMPIDIHSPWHRICDVYEGLAVLTPTSNRRSLKRAVSLLSNSSAKIRLIVKCEGDFFYSDAALETVRLRFPSGRRWLQALYPSLKADVVLEIRT